MIIEPLRKFAESDCVRLLHRLNGLESNAEELKFLGPRICCSADKETFKKFYRKMEFSMIKRRQEEEMKSGKQFIISRIAVTPKDNDCAYSGDIIQFSAYGFWRNYI